MGADVRRRSRGADRLLRLMSGAAGGNDDGVAGASRRVRRHLRRHHGWRRHGVGAGLARFSDPLLHAVHALRNAERRWQAVFLQLRLLLLLLLLLFLLEFGLKLLLEGRRRLMQRAGARLLLVAR